MPRCSPLLFLFLSTFAFAQDAGTAVPSHPVTCSQAQGMVKDALARYRSLVDAQSSQREQLSQLLVTQVEISEGMARSTAVPPESIMKKLASTKADAQKQLEAAKMTSADLRSAHEVVEALLMVVEKSCHEPPSPPSKPQKKK
jgi:DNA phosphorothioation-dependent restriction protein DptG